MATPDPIFKQPDGLDIPTWIDLDELFGCKPKICKICGHEVESVPVNLNTGNHATCENHVSEGYDQS